MVNPKDIEKALFDTARSLVDPEAQQAFLDRACAGDLPLRSRLLGLLEAAGVADRFFDQPAEVATLGDAPDEAPLPPARAPDLAETRIGRYKLLERLGEGGCGVVYMAEQEEPVRRRVALKVIRLGMDTESVVARFEAERQALALMDHPNIAHVLDAGATESGRPYFVMELVRGVKITQFCDEHQLDIPARLELFIQTCHAIQHAHQKGIIHRDIKPSNILVTLHDGKPVPKVIDFGIAKAVEGRLTDNTLFTAFEQFIGTPAYMSPEQAEMSGLDVDTRSDVYSLGVLLYELLTGRTPFDTKKLLQSGMDEMRRTLREREPQPPSGLLTTLNHAELSAVASQHHAEPPKLISLLRGDLDWIVMKALEKDRSRRYETVNGLAMDVQRYLNNEPVVARPPSRLYRLQKLVLRNRALFTAIGIVVTALVASSAVSTRLFFKEREARRRAVAAEQQEARLRTEAERLQQAAEDRQKLSEATALFTRGRTEDADTLLDELHEPKVTLEHAVMYRTLGDRLAAHGEWHRAASRFAVLAQIDEPRGADATTLDVLRHASLEVELGNLTEYRRYRDQLITQYGSTEDPLVAERIVRASLLIPADGGTLSALQPLAEVAEKSLEISSQQVPLDMAAWRAYALALLEYRRGNYRRAVDWCERSLDYDQGVQSRVAGVNLVLAVASWKQGHADEAHAALDRGRDILDDVFQNGVIKTRKWEGYWFDWIDARIRLREANQVIENKVAPPSLGEH